MTSSLKLHEHATPKVAAKTAQKSKLGMRLSVFLHKRLAPCLRLMQGCHGAWGAPLA